VTKPWDILNPNIDKTPEDVQKERMGICAGCEHFIKMTNQCKKCGCIMTIKTKLLSSTCPIEKW
jgi:hypothetical protein